MSPRFPRSLAAWGVDRSTVRRWVTRFQQQRVQGLMHAATGKSKRSRFGDSIRDAIVRLAMASPHNAGEEFDTWSLRRLRAHVIRRGLVRDISVEGLRQLVRGVPLPSEFWRRKRPQPLRLSAEDRAGLEQLLAVGRPEAARRARLILARANGLHKSEIAAAVGVGLSTVRHWLRRFRKHGILGLQTQRKPIQPSIFTPEVRRKILLVAAALPRDYGLARPHWSLRTLRTVLMQRNVVRNISIQHLRRIVSEAGVDLRAPAIPHHGFAAKSR